MSEHTLYSPKFWHTVKLSPSEDLDARYHSIKLWCNRIEKVVGKYVGEIGTRVANLTHFYINILGNGLYLLQEIFSYLRLTDDDVAESGGKELESSRNDT